MEAALHCACFGNDSDDVFDLCICAGEKGIDAGGELEADVERRVRWQGWLAAGCQEMGDADWGQGLGEQRAGDLHGARDERNTA